MKTPRFYRSLPEGYAPVYTVDAKNRRTAVCLTLASLLPVAAFLIPILLSVDWKVLTGDRVGLLIADAAFIVGMVAYIILHELVHGAVYKLLTHEKLTFGLTLAVAYCGVPEIFVTRATALAALVMPFSVFTVLLLPLVIVLRAYSLPAFLAAGLIFAIHIGGCVGDLFDTALLLFRFRDKRLLMRDTGPLQTFYLPVAPAPAEEPSAAIADTAAEAPQSPEAPAEVPPDASEKQ